MPLVDAGRNFMVQSTFAAASTPFNSSNAYIGVGDSTTNATPTTYTDLQAASNKLRKQVTSGPTGGSNVITLQTSFGTSEANWAWQEWAVFNASSGGTMLCRKVESLGTKTSSQTWQFTITLTFTTA